ARAPNVVGGSASARARGKIDVGKRTIQATTNVTAESVTAAAFSARHVTAHGVVSGPLASPVVDVGFAGTDMQVRATGKAPLVYPSASGHARIALVPTPRVVDAEINVGQTGSADTITASARGVHVVNGVVEANGLRVTGLGEPLELDARIGQGAWSVRAKSAGVDLRRAARVTGIKELEAVPEGTRATLDVDVRQGSEGADGHIDVAIRSEKGLTESGALVAEAHANVQRGKLIGSGKIAAEGFGHIEITNAELDVPRQLDARSLQRATGVVEMRGTIDLSQGAALFAGENVERVAGIASFEARIERGDPASLPAIRGTVRTEGLEIALSGAPPAPTILITGVDLQTHVAWDGRTEDAELAVLSWDKEGLLGDAGVKMKLPIAAWATAATSRSATARASSFFAPVAHVPARDLAELPPFIGAPPMRGKVEGHVAIEGTIGHPQVIVSGRADRIREDRRRSLGPPSFDPLDGTLEARWDGDRAAITFALDERERRRRSPGPERTPKDGPPQKQPGHLRGLVLVTDARMSDLLAGKPLSWAASTELEVENLALGALPFLPAGMTGTLTGRARVKDLNREPSFEAKAHVDDFGAGGARVESLDLTAGGRDGSLFAHTSIVDRREQDATQATLQLASKSLRLKGTEVSWDHSAPTRLDYAIQNGRLALLAPLVKRSISEIDGRVDGAGSVTIEESSQIFEGGLALQDARLYVNVLGEEITSLDATARFDRTGIFRIDDATGKMGSGEFRASANGQMKGFRFMGAEATIIASKDGIPISSEGATFAEATGEAKVSAKMSEDRKTLLMTLDLPRATVEVPDRDTQELQDLDPDPTIAIGVRRRDGELDTSAVRKSRGGTGKQGAVTTTSESLVTRLNVTLGDEVRLTGRGLDVKLGGRTLVELAQELSVTGRIDVRGGTIEVHGRRFTVDRGTVTFPDMGDPANPTIVAAAYWDAPDRTRVWVEFAGPLKTGTITLRSEPPYSKNEILSVLLFGRPDPNTAVASGKAGSSSGASAAVGIGIGDFNRALSQLDKDLDVETDTLSGNRTRVKVGRSFFDRRLKVQFAPTLGRATYREPDTYYLFLNWQFIPKWSIVAQRGDKGTSILDVLFQHRY
ncbi:MAG TPA: translocation/assembly module TamB domain-containing protein, partial [Labilithrix sp.]|nr:translocation/assembly module TamB domain-containing protein [Labilithrix sp.]